MRIHRVGLLVGVGELEPPDIILVEAIPLQRVDHKRCLKIILEVCEAKNDLFVRVDLTRDQPDRLESFKWPEDV